jgi:hypothetical protein
MRFLLPMATRNRFPSHRDYGEKSLPRMVPGVAWNDG